MRLRALWVVVICVLAVACGVDTAPDGARRTPAGDGPKIVFDLLHRPLPEIPQPNDIATFADPTSRTGRRINVSLVSPTRLETVARQGFASLEGWGTFAPLTVAFAKTDDGSPAIDLQNVASRSADWDPGDDPFYVIDLTTGIPIPLDMGKGDFPLTIVDPNKYWPNDPRKDQDALLLESVEEGAGQSYRPALDTDFDGVLDHPNVLAPTGKNATVEQMLNWYERESDTLILRPVVPMEEKREYAVVLTDRLVDSKGRPVRSPFDFIHHPQQRAGADRVREILSDPNKRAWFGDVAGTGLDRVAFLWTFTTQPTYEDMRLLRDGLHGVGPFARLATDFPPIGRAFRAVGLAREPEDEVPGAIDADPNCTIPKKTPYLVRVADTKDEIRQLLQTAIGLNGPELDRLDQSLFENVDHFVVGYFESPYFLGDPKKEDPDGKFELNYKTGEGRVARDTVQFWISIPKTTAEHHQPFPTTVWAHGTTLHADEIIVRAGYWAKQGLAMMGINMPGHGLYLGPGLETAAEVFTRQACLIPWVTALVSGRAQDLDGDGVPDSGGLLWTAHIFHSRDNIRQAVVDEMQATRVLRAFGTAKSDQDYNADGQPDLLGDFDGDGVPDLGGPTVPITTSGNSFGGILAMVHGAIDPNVTAAAPISGAGALTDIATRSALVPDSVLEQVFTPLIVAEPGSTIRPKNDIAQTRCTGDQRSVRFVVNDLTISKEVEIACLTPAELDAGKTIVLENLRNGERRCARSDTDGRFRIPIPANVGDRLDVQIYDAPDAIDSYATCNVLPNAPVGRRIQTFEQAGVVPLPVGDETKTCDAAFADSGLEQNNGCAQYRDVFYPVGAPLVSPQEGLGLRRQSPDARRLFTITQAAIDPSDPVNFAPYYSLRPAIGPDGKPLGPRAVIEFNTAGDPMVPVAGGYAFARAAGALPFLPPSMATTNPEWAAYATPQALFDQLGGKTPNQVLVENWSIEGVSRMNRTRGGASCTPNYVTSATCTDSPAKSECSHAVFDPDWLAEGADLWAQGHPAIPLRLAKRADVAASDVEKAWAPRLTGVPFAPDASGWSPQGPLLGVLDTYIEPGGTHVFVNGNPCRAFDEVVYYDHTLVRFLATQGTDAFYLTHPTTHRCLATESCAFMQGP